MPPDLLNYSKSFLNPALKILVPLVFLYAAYYLYQSRQKYGGALGQVIRRLALAALVGFLAMGFRYVGDIVTVTWKWGESLGYLALGLANLYAVWPLLAYASKLERAETSAGQAGPS